MLGEDADVAGVARELTDGAGVDVVVDFVGSDATHAVALGMLARQGLYSIVGFGGTVTHPSVGFVAGETAVTGNLVGNWIDLWELMQLHTSGAVTLRSETHRLEEVNDVLDKLREGEVTGRAVLVRDERAGEDLRRPGDAGRRHRRGERARLRDGGGARRLRRARHARRPRRGAPRGSTARLTERGAAARSFVVDVSDEAQVEALVADVVAAEGGIDVVFANAGIAAVPGPAQEGGQRIDTVERSDWDRVLGVNLSGVLFTMKHTSGVMRRQGSGRIVVTSSNAGLKPEPVVCYGYTASKAAVINVVRQAALELAPDGVLVNAICPGPFKGTRIGGGVTMDPEPEQERMWSTTVPLGEWPSPTS